MKDEKEEEEEKNKEERTGARMKYHLNYGR